VLPQTKDSPSRKGSIAATFAEELADIATAAGLKGVKCLVQCAGVYDFGRFLDHDVSRRKNVLGVNVLGTTEVLHAVMVLNDPLRVQNEKNFINVLVASFQGLYALRVL
jgi:short-subunit dehydrogenase